MPYGKQKMGSGAMNADRARQEQQAKMQGQMMENADRARQQQQGQIASAQKSQRNRVASNSPSTPWSTSGRKNRMGG